MPHFVDVPLAAPPLMEYAGRNGTIDASLWDRLPPELYAGIQKHMPQGRPVYGIIKRMMQDNDVVFDSTAPVGDACPYRERFDAITPLQSPKGLEITGISFQFVVDRDNFHEEFGMWPPHADDNESDIHGVLQYTTLCCDMDLADNEALPHVIKPVPGQRFPLRFEDGDVRTALLQCAALRKAHLVHHVTVWQRRTSQRYEHNIMYSLSALCGGDPSDPMPPPPAIVRKAWCVVRLLCKIHLSVLSVFLLFCSHRGTITYQPI